MSQLYALIELLPLDIYIHICSHLHDKDFINFIQVNTTTWNIISPILIDKYNTLKSYYIFPGQLLNELISIRLDKPSLWNILSKISETNFEYILLRIPNTFEFLINPLNIDIYYPEISNGLVKLNSLHLQDAKLCVKQTDENRIMSIDSWEDLLKNTTDKTVIYGRNCGPHGQFRFMLLRDKQIKSLHLIPSS